MLQAVIFDFGQVISLPPEPRFMKELARLAGLDEASMYRIVWADRGEYDRGTYTGKEYYRYILAKVGIQKEDTVLEELARLDCAAWTNLDPATVRLMEDVKAAGLKLGILSNMPHDFLALARTTLPIFRKTDVAVFSCETGSIKPEKPIYEKLIAACGCKPEEIVFFDDVPANVEAARELGIRAFLWKGAEDGRKRLAGLGLKV